MGNLGDAFKKAGLINEQELRRQKHEERVHRKEVGHRGAEAENRAHAAEQERRERDRRARDRAIEDERRAGVVTDETRARARDLLRAHALTENVRGGRRWHFVERDLSIPFLMVHDDLARRLEAGELGIAAGGLVVPRATALEARGLDPEAVRFLNG